ncbi:MAG TPA: UbiA family prenyltransferase, partial [Streptosporangiaceae bacterium]|nr:UbiA family prenyltransferase [Streptosporangiaceae bacterium]
MAGRRSARVVARSLFALTKPRIIELLLVTTIPTMLLAARGLPSAGLLAVTLVGGALAAGSANTINCYLDRDIDAKMRRTSRRPLAKPAALAV